jgi:hypothetical protein
LSFSSQLVLGSVRRLACCADVTRNGAVCRACFYREATGELVWLGGNVRWWMGEPVDPSQIRSTSLSRRRRCFLMTTPPPSHNLSLGCTGSVGVLLTQVTRVVLLPHFKNKKLHCAYTETNLETELSTCTYCTNHPQRRRHSSMFRFTASQGNVADKVRLDLYRTFFLFFERKKID